MATYDLTSSIPSSSSLTKGDILNCPYSGTYKSITLPKGTYKLECWGAQGGAGSYSSNGTAGKGGYSYGTLTLSSSTTLYLYTGGQGGTGSTSATGGYNGGGAVTYSGGTANDCAGGGGASHIATSSGVLSLLSSSTSSILLVAGGGGGIGWNWTPIGGYGGGVTGGNGSSSNSNTYGLGGTQSAGGAAASNSPSSGSTTAGSFGQGGSGAGNSDGGAGGGGGYYGGGGGTVSAGGGGSGYVNTSKLTSASTIAGNSSFTSPTGSSETGHSGNGYIRITVQSIANWAYSTVSISAPTYNKQNTSSWTLSPSACRYFSFTPTISGDFVVYSNSSIDTYGYLTSNIASLNSNGQPSSNILVSDDDSAKKYGGSGSNFGICYKVTAGTTYYIFVKPYSNSTSSSSVYLTYFMARPDSRVFVKTDSTTWKLITN